MSDFEPIYSETHGESESIKSLREGLENSFSEYYSNLGYQEVSSVPLLEHSDNSVLFVGASISAIKDLLLSGDFPQDTNGVFLFQECIRTGAREHMFDNSWLPFGQIYFEMASILSRPGRSSEVISESLEFLLEKMEISQERIKILSSKNICEYSDLDVSVEVEYDSREEDFYTWVYGIDGVTGEGLTIAIYNSQLNSWLEIGNIVSIYDRDGNELGIEFGFGCEYFLTALKNADNPLQFSKVFDVFDYSDGLPLKYYYNLEAVAQMKGSGVNIGDHGAENVYKNYLKSLQYVAHTLGLSVDIVVSDLDRYTREVLGVESEFDIEKSFLDEHQRRKENLKSLVKRICVFLWNDVQGNKHKEYFTDPARTINDYLLQNGIQKIEVMYLLERLRRFGILEQIN